ncbi:HWE histidine kinase domain-containing protein [Roseibium sp.]|uniref:HWE histidine kinase domain-containing protein n=1 Tax=Roseibium sp. TaxID=1936156 RepID=UPI003A973F42
MGNVDLTNCDREPIHLLGGVQNFGCLLAFSSDWVVTHASDNCARFVGRTAKELIGAASTEILSDSAIHTLRTRLQWLQFSDTSERIFNLDVFGFGIAFDVALHLSGERIVVELEPCEETDRIDAVSLVRSMMGRLGRTEQLDDYLISAARQIRFVTGYDRVMVYRFMEDGAGEVIAESAVDHVDSFLGLRYPASDIPKQARALYVKNQFRIIADVGGAVSAVVAAPGDDAPLDLSLSVLRSVSPIHIEYLKNMGVAASLSISIVVGGQLWGLFACHHYAPKQVGFDRRTAAELFSQMFSLELSRRQTDELYEHEAQARTVHDRIMTAISVEGSIFDNLSRYLPSFQDVIECDGVAVWVDGDYAVAGNGLSEAEMMAFLPHLNGQRESQIYATASLPSELENWSGASDVPSRFPGVLAIPVSRSPRDYLVFFRRERAQTVNWAGNPEKPVELGPNGARLTPRKSFEIWKQEVAGTSAPWTPSELRIAETLRTTLLEIILKSVSESEKLRQQSKEKQDLLIGELNHRVRNILTLIRGLVSQTGRSARSIDDFKTVLGDRVQALARAHDQITRENWSPAPFRGLIENELAAYVADKSSRAHLKGPAVLLSPQAYSTLALVLHEMVTNAVKYGCLSVQNGRLTVTWSQEQDGSLAIRWHEQGGPSVAGPRHEGFGSTLIKRSIPFELHGDTELDFAPTGLRATFKVPSSHIVAMTGGLQEPDQSAGAEIDGPKLPHDSSVLLVEDNVIIALDAEDMLHSLGFADVRVQNRVADGLAALEETSFGLAVLDINLGEETSLPIADRLSELGTPFIFASGYGDTGGLPERFQDCIVLTKPYTLENLEACVTEMLSRNDREAP